MCFEPFAWKFAVLRLVRFNLVKRRAGKPRIERRQRRKVTLGLITLDLGGRKMVGHV
jgi:hypothetical protein